MEDESLEPRELQESLKAASPILVRIIEVIIATLCFCLIYVPHDNKLSTSFHRAGIVWTAFLFTIFVNIVILVSHFRRFPTPKLALYMYSGISCILLFTTGCLLVSEWWIYMHSIRFLPPKLFMDLMMSCAFFSFFLTGVVIADIYLTYKYY